jgi:hypothetical protein
MRYLSICLSCLIIVAHTVQAAEPVPGESCPANGATIASAENGNGHFMICESGTWQAVYSYNASGAFTKLGNQNCASGEILKFNGSVWACAAAPTGGSGASGTVGGGCLNGGLAFGNAVSCPYQGEITCPAGYTARIMIYCQNYGACAYNGYYSYPIGFCIKD